MGGKKARKPGTLNVGLALLVFSFQFLLIFSLCGCSVVALPFILPSPDDYPKYNANPSDRYDKITLKESGAFDILPMIQKPEFELLSQSRSVVASSGRSETGYRTWFNMVAFDENKLTAKRKYFFSVNENIKQLGGKLKCNLDEPKQGLMFYSQMVMNPEALKRARTYESAGQIAILIQVLKYLRKDMDELGRSIDTPGSASKALAVSELLLNQVFGTILYNLSNSPAQAAILDEEGGAEFDHINFGKGRVQMFSEKDIVTVKIRLGAFIDMAEKQKKKSSGKKVKSAG